MITQCYISPSLAGLDFKTKYGFTDYLDSSKPLALFGMYREEDLDVFRSHKGLITLIWQGSDAKNIPVLYLEELRKKPARHIAISHWNSASLKKYGIDHECIAVSATIDNLQPCPRGDSIYFYSSDESKESADLYGEYMLEEIKNRTGLNIIRGTLTTFNKEELVEMYKKCFINLRLTKYDGCPNTNLEMGMMGRRSVFNGLIPHSLAWGSVEDICETIMREYENRHLDNSYISKDIKEFLRINQLKFLHHG